MTLDTPSETSTPVAETCTIGITPKEQIEELDEC